MLKRIGSLPAHVVALEAEGTVSAEDYETVLIPAVEEALKEHGKVSFLMVLGDAFETYEAGALWDDTVFGFKHLTDFKKVGVVTDRNWIAETMRLLSPLIPAETLAFPLKKREQALKWIAN